MFPCHILRSGFMLLSLAALSLSGGLRHATVTAPPQLLRRQDVCVDATDTPCPDGVGCCPSTEPCEYDQNTPICGGPCNVLSVTCSNVDLCCPAGSTCSAISPWLCHATGTVGNSLPNTITPTSTTITTPSVVQTNIYYTVITWTYYVYWYVEFYVSINIVNTQNSVSLASSATIATTSTFCQATNSNDAQSSFQLISVSLSSSAASAESQKPVPTSATYLVAGSSTVPYTPTPATATASGTSPGTSRTSTPTSILAGSGTSEGVRRVESLFTWALGLVLAGLGL